jgi:putative phage-type endonuclease
MIIYNIEQHSEAWHEARCGRVTGTRFKNLVSKETTDSYKDLVTNIACEIITGEAEETYVSPAMQYGIDTEPEARREYETITDVSVTQVGFVIPDEEHKYHSWIGISPDGILPDDGILEIKCPLARTHFEYIERGVLPAEYRYQVQGQLFVTGFKYCHFMSYVPGMKPFIIEVLPDTELFELFNQRLDKLIIEVQEKLTKYQNYKYDE